MSEPVTMALMAKAFTAISTYGTAISAGLGVASTAVAYNQASVQAKTLEASNAEANNRARQYMIEDQDAMTSMGQQEKAAATQKINENQTAAQKAAASASVAAGAGGVSGLSVDALLGDIFGQEAGIRDSVNQNLENTGQQMQRERGSIQRGYVNAVNTRQQPQHPSLLGATLQAGTSVVGAYKDTWKIRNQTGR